MTRVWLTIEAGLMLCLMMPASYLWRFRTLERWCGNSHVIAGRDCDPVEVGWAVERFGRRMPGSRCLDRALVGLWMLRRRGLSAQIVMGAAKKGTQLAAHAWVECAGLVVVGAKERNAFVALRRP